MKTALKLSWFLLFLVSACTSVAQNRTTDTSATCMAFWKNKETRIYHIIHGKEKYGTYPEKKLSEVSYEAHIKIIDSASTGYTIEWVYKNYKMTGTTEQTLNSVNTLMEGLKIIYKTDDVGSFTELVNWKEVRDFFIDLYEKGTTKPSQDKEYITALNQVKAIFQSKENIEALLIKEVQLYHASYGVEYTFAGTEMETQLPNVTGGQPFPAKIIIKLDELNTQKGLCKVSLNQVIDKGKAGPIIAAMLKKMSASAKTDEVEIQKQIKDMEISDVNEFTYSLNTGWLSRVYFKRTSNVGDYKQVEFYEITEKN